MSRYQPENYKFNVATKAWTKLPNWEPGMYRLSFNLMPLVENRYILIVSEKFPFLFDTNTDKFIRLEQRGHTFLKGVQIGAFLLPNGWSSFRHKVKNVVQIPQISSLKTGSNLAANQETVKDGSNNFESNNKGIIDTSKLYGSERDDPFSESSSDEEDNDLYDESQDPLYDSDDSGQMDDEDDDDKDGPTKEQLAELEALTVEIDQKKQSPDKNSKRRLNFAKKLSSDVFIREKVENRIIEMIWFGGIGHSLSSNVFHVTLEANYKDTSDTLDASSIDVSSGTLRVRRLRNRQGKHVKLKHPDRFFYN